MTVFHSDYAEVIISMVTVHSQHMLQVLKVMVLFNQTRHIIVDMNLFFYKRCLFNTFPEEMSSVRDL